MKHRFTVLLLALLASLLLGLGVFFVACDGSTEGGGHTHTMTYIAAEEATCTEEGNVAYWHCSGCGKNFSDEAGENELTSIIIPAETHSFGVWEDDDNGTTHTRTCACGETETEDHTFGAWVDNGDGTHIHSCSICGKEETAAHVLDEETNSYCTVCGFISDYTQGLAYSYADGGYTVTGIGTATASKIIIPATYNDGANGSAAVIGIGSSAFRGCRGLTEITIPEEVTSIGSSVFACFCIEIHACLQAGGRRQEEVYSATSEVSRYGKCKPDSLLHDDFIQFFSGVGEHHDGGWEFSVCFVFGCAVCALGARNVRF